MAWRDSLRPASFRGVPFFVEGSQHTTGRRVVAHEFPNRDNPYPEDLGKIGNVWKVEGHILGDDYLETKRLLKEAVEKFGAGELVHPFYGTLFVQCGAVSFDESTLEGGFARISFQFYEGGDNRYPRATDEKLVTLANKSADAISKSKSAFDSVYSIAKAPAFVVDSARSGVNAVADLYTESTKGAVAVAEGAADLAYGVRNLKAEVNDLLQEPEKLSQRLIDSFGLLENALALPDGKLKAYSKFFVYGRNAPAILGNTFNRQRERNNKDALDKFVRRAAVANAVNTAPTVEFASSEDALQARNDLENEIEDILMNAEDDDVFAAFEDLKALLADLVPDQETNLPNVQSITLQDTQPSLTVVYDLFESPDSEEDLIARNSISNPAFIGGGTTLEVLDVRKGT